MKTLLFKLFEISRRWKRVMAVGVDSVFIIAAFYVALFIRLGNERGDWYNIVVLYALAATLVTSLIVWYRMGLYRTIIRYLDTNVLTTVAVGCATSGAIMVAASFLFMANIPRSVPLIYMAVLFIMVTGSRLLIREIINSKNSKDKDAVIIYGAGASGSQLCMSLRGGAEFKPVAFVDDKKELQGNVIAGVKVYDPQLLGALLVKNKANKVLLAIPSASQSQKKSIIRNVEALKVQILTIPGSADLVSGKCKINELRNVAIEELLGREAVKPNEQLLNKCIQGKHVLVTGAGGSNRL